MTYRLNRPQRNARYEQGAHRYGGSDACAPCSPTTCPRKNQGRLETRIEMSFWERVLNNPKLLDVQRRESAELQRMLRELIK